MERPNLSSQYGDLQLYTVSRPLLEESAEYIRGILEKLELATKVDPQEFQLLGSATSWITPRDTRDVFRDLAPNDPRRQKDAKWFNDIIFSRAEQVERKRPAIGADFGSAEVFGSITSGHERGSQFIIVPLLGSAAVHFVNERNEAINQLAYPTNASLNQYQKGIRPHLSLVLTDESRTAETLKKDVRKVIGKNPETILFGAPVIDTVPYFSNPRAYQKYLRERRQRSRDRRVAQLGQMAQAA